MPLNLNSDKLIVVVKPEQQQIIYTGATTNLVNVGGGVEIYAGLQGTASKIRTLVPSGDVTITQSGNTIVIGASPSGSTYNFIGSGITDTTHISGNTWVIYTPATDLSDYWTTGETQNAINLATSGLTSSWSGLTGQPTDNSDLMTLFDGKSNTGHTHTIANVSGLQSALDGKSNTGHTHSQYSPTGHTHTISNVTGLQSALDGKSNTGHTHAYSGLTGLPILFTGNTFVGSGSTSVNVVGDVVTIYSTPSTGTTASWNDITNKPSWLSGTTLGAFESGHAHSQYLTGVTWNDVTGKPDVALNADLTGLTQTVNSHTGDTSIHFKMSDITGFTSTNDFNTFTGTTLPANYYDKNDVNGLISGFTTGYTFTQSGATVITQVGNNITIYSPTGGTGSSAWSDITGKPSWLSGTTLNAFESAHSHSQYLTGITWTDVSDKPAYLGYVSGLTSDAQTQIDSKASKLADILVVTGTTDTIANTDSGKIIKYTNSSARTITLPTGLTTNLQFTAINYGGTTAVTFQAGTGATLRSKNSALKLATIYGAATCIYEGSNIWVLFGDLTV